jgi:hypothetical protein
MWQREFRGAPGSPESRPPRPPSPECRRAPAPVLPTSHVNDYRGALAAPQQGGFKCIVQAGRVQLVPAFPQGYNGVAVERYATGETYVGQVSGARREGPGTYREADGRAMLSFWRGNKPVSEGARWSTDRRAAHRVFDGKPDGSIALKEAGGIAKRLGLPCPEDSIALSC